MATPTKYGSEFLVNTITLNAQDAPSVKALANGKFVIAWTDSSGLGGDTFDRGIAAQLFHADGSKLGSQFLVNPVTTADQRGPDIGAFSDGRFVISWLSGPAADLAGGGLLRIFNADGSSVVPQQGIISGQPEGSPRLTVLTDGTIAATASLDTGANNDIAVESTNGGAVFFTPAGNQIEPRTATLSDGTFVVVWWTAGGGTDFLTGQKFNANGTTLGGQFAIETTTAGAQQEPEVAALPGGGFVVVWIDDPGPGDPVIRARIFPGAGVAGPDFVVNTTPASFLAAPNVTTLADGRFMVAWQTGGIIRAQLFSAAGAPDGSEFVVNTTLTDLQVVPTVSLTTLTDGRVVVAWSDVSESSGDISDSAVRAQILDPRGVAINLIGTALGDEWVGTDFNDTMRGAGGDDRLDGGGGIDTAVFSGNSAAYTITPVAGGGSRVTGPDGTDFLTHMEFAAFDDQTISLLQPLRLVGTEAGEVLQGGDGGDTLLGLGGDDTMLGGEGSDTIAGGGGTNFIAGGAGIDALDYTASPAGVGVNLETGGAANGFGGLDFFSGIENVNGSESGDLFYGDGNANVLAGWGGNDTIVAAGGDDTILTGAGTNYVDGGAGIDTLSYGPAPGPVGVNMETGGASNGYGGFDFFSGIENVTGSAFADLFYGNGADNVLNGGAGADTMSGRGGLDTFVLVRGEAHGDVVTDFDGAGAGAGDTFRFVGYGPGATLTQVDATHWSVNSGDGLVHDVITLANGAGVHASDYLLV